VNSRKTSTLKPVEIPQDLCKQAIKLARRIQALPSNKVFMFMLIKLGEQWVLAEVGNGKAEMLKKTIDSRHNS